MRDTKSDVRDVSKIDQSLQNGGSYKSTTNTAPVFAITKNEKGESSLNIIDDGQDTNISSRSFSFRKLWKFSGPGFLMSIAYLDPGNIESDIRSGAEAKYQLLWVVLWATFLGLLIQRLAARLGTVTGIDLAQVCASRFARLPRYILWIMLEITIVGADMQEVIGTAIAFYLISNKRIPLYGGVLITVADAFTFLFLDKYGLRKLEGFFALLIALMAFTFGYEYITVSPDQHDVLKGLFIPGCFQCSRGVLLQAVGIVGALITPHNLYLHSSLVKSRKIDRKDKGEISDANRYFLIESSIALFISLIINIFIVSVFAQGLYGKTNAEVLQVCLETDPDNSAAFPNDTTPLNGDIYKAGLYLGCQFGQVPMYIWAVGLLAAGQSSTMTGTYTGQFVMEGFINLKLSKWKRILLTRSIAILPTILVAIFKDITQMTSMNDFLNALMSMQLPFALMTTFIFTSSHILMGNFVNGKFTKVLMGIVIPSLIILNLYFVFDFVQRELPNIWVVYVAIAVFIIFYMTVLIYLALCLLVVLGLTSLTRIPLIGKYLVESYKERKKNDDDDTDDVSGNEMADMANMADNKKTANGIKQ